MRRDVVEVLRELLDVGIVAARRPAQHDRRHRIASPGARPMPRSMRPGRGGLQQGELLGDGQRRMVGQHDAARAEPDLRGLRGQVGDQHRRAGGRDRGHVVVFGQPVAGEAEPVGGLRQPHRRRQRIRRGLVGAHGDKVEDRKPHETLNAIRRPTLPGAHGAQPTNARRRHCGVRSFRGPAGAPAPDRTLLRLVRWRLPRSSSRSSVRWRSPCCAPWHRGCRRSPTTRPARWPG